MPYRSIKSVFGETSLERKCRFLFGASLLLLITASFWLYGGETEQIVYQQNRNTGKLLMRQMLLTKHSAIAEPNETFRPLAKHLTEMLSEHECTFEFIVPPRQRAYADDAGAQDDGERRFRDGFLHGKPPIPADADNPELRRKAPAQRGQVRILPADPRLGCFLRRLPPGAGGRVGYRRHRHGNAAYRRGFEHPLVERRHHGHRQGDHPHPRHPAQHQPEPRLPHHHGDHHRFSGDGHRLRDRPLRDRQAPAPPPRRCRRDQPRKHRPAGGHPHRRRV